MAHRILGAVTTLAGMGVFQNEMHRVIDDDAKRHRDNNGHCQRDIADHIAPQAEPHRRRHKIRHQRDQPELEVAKHKEDHEGDEDKCQRCPLQH